MKMRASNKTADKRFARSRGGNFMVYLLLAISGFVFALPLIFAVVNSIKPFDEIFIYPPRLYVVNPTTDNFIDLFALCSNTWVPFSKYLFNSLSSTVIVTVAMVVISSMCAFPLAKNRFPGKKIIFNVIVSALLFVPAVTFLPQYLVISKIGLIDNYLVLILPSLGTTLGVFLMKQFMETIPDALLEAARIDGCTEFGTLFKIVMPNVKPAWLTLVIFTFQSAWNNTSSQQYIFKERLRTLPTLLNQIVSGSTMARAGAAAAASVVLMIPPILLFILSQASVMQTMAHAGLKE